jgi:hypothetical protein
MPANADATADRTGAVSKRYGLRRRLKRLAKADGIHVPNDWTPDQIAEAIAEKWNEEWAPIFADRYGDAAVEPADDDCPF